MRYKFAPQRVTSFLSLQVCADLGNNTICSPSFASFSIFAEVQTVCDASVIRSFWEQRGWPLTNVGQTSQKKIIGPANFRFVFRCFVGLVDQNANAKVCWMSAKNDKVEIRQATRQAHCGSAKTFHDDCLVDRCFFSGTMKTQLKHRFRYTCYTLFVDKNQAQWPPWLSGKHSLARPLPENTWPLFLPLEAKVA